MSLLVAGHFSHPRLQCAEEGSPGSRGRAFLPATEEGFFPWAGPLAQYKHRHGPTSLLPPPTSIATMIATSKINFRQANLKLSTKCDNTTNTIPKIKIKQ